MSNDSQNAQNSQEMTLIYNSVQDSLEKAIKLAEEDVQSFVVPLSEDMRDETITKYYHNVYIRDSKLQCRLQSYYMNVVNSSQNLKSCPKKCTGYSTEVNLFANTMVQCNNLAILIAYSSAFLESFTKHIKIRSTFPVRVFDSEQFIQKHVKYQNFWLDEYDKICHKIVPNTNFQNNRHEINFLIHELHRVRVESRQGKLSW